jgi:hypothetical protein
MKTKQFLVLILVLTLGTAVSFAQKHHRGGKGTIEDRINHKLDKMDAVVKFTGNQRADLKNLLTDLAKKKKDAFCANELGTDDMKNAMKAIRKEQKEGVKKILTKDQLNLWKDYRKAQHDSKKGDHPKKGVDDNFEDK